MHDPTRSGTEADEKHLVVQARDGDQTAFRLLVESHMKRAYDLAFWFLNDHDAAEDVAQEAFVRAHRAIQSFRGDAEFGTWLHRIVVNLSLDSIRATKRRPTQSMALAGDEWADPDPLPESLHNREIARHVERALHELPTLQRSTIILRHFEGLSTKQVSKILGCSEGTVKTHLFRGLKKLKEKLQFLKDDAQ